MFSTSFSLKMSAKLSMPIWAKAPPSKMSRFTKVKFLAESNLPVRRSMDQGRKRRNQMDAAVQLHALGHNLGDFLRALAAPEPIKDWSLTSLKERLIKMGAQS
jgi:hypothetical protein